MLRILFLQLIASFVLLAAPVVADVRIFSPRELSVEQELDEINALRYYTGVLNSLDSIKYITSTSRGSARPSDWVEDGLGAEGSGKLLREAGKALRLLATASDTQNQAWVSRWERFNDLTGSVGKVSAMINALAEYVDATSHSDTSSAAQKLRSLAEIIRDTNKLIPSGTPISIYVGKLADGVEAIAHDAAIIESATQKKNDAIEQVNELLVGGNYKRPAEDDLVSIVSALESEIERLERDASLRARAEASGVIQGAEDDCSNALGLGQEEISELRRQTARERRELSNINQTKKLIGHRISVLPVLIADAQLAISQARIDTGSTDAETALNAINRLTSLEDQLAKYLQEQEAKEKGASKRIEALNARERDLQAQLKKQQLVQSAFDDCVIETLGETDVELEDIIDTYFPQYDKAADAGGEATIDATVYLSDLDEVSVENIAYGLGKNSVPWGEGLRFNINGRSYAHGLVTHPPTTGSGSFGRVEYDLDGEFKVFFAVAGRVEDADERGCQDSIAMRYRVIVDGKERAAGDFNNSRVLSIDVDNARSLILEVNDGDDGPWCDHAGWGDAKLLR